MNSTSPRRSRTLRRSSSDKHVAGVSGGLADYFDVDPVLMRVGFVVTALAGGGGLLAYLLLWILVDREEQPIPGDVTPAVA